MTLPLRNLHDRTFAELVADAQAEIAVHCPEWTDHNPSDPGIALIELFASLSDMLLYQINRAPELARPALLRLLRGNLAWTSGLDPDADLRETLLALRKRQRAVSADDYAELLRSQWAGGAIRQLRCLSGINLSDSAASDQPGHLSLIVMAEPSLSIAELPLTFPATAGSMATYAFTPQTPGLLLAQATWKDNNLALSLVAQQRRLRPRPGDVFATVAQSQGQPPLDLSVSIAGAQPFSILPWQIGLIAPPGARPPKNAQLHLRFIPDYSAEIEAWLNPHRLLGTRLHVVAPRLAEIAIKVSVTTTMGAPGDTLARAAAALRSFYDPLEGGLEGRGWPLGRGVFRSDIYRVIESVNGIDYLSELTLTPATGDDWSQQEDGALLPAQPQILPLARPTVSKEAPQ